MRSFTLITFENQKNGNLRTVAVRTNQLDNVSLRHLNRFTRNRQWSIIEMFEQQAPSLKHMMDDLYHYIAVYRRGYDW